MKFDTVISGAVILSAHNGFVPFVGSVGVLDGKIAWVTDRKIPPSEGREWIDGSCRILMPGLVNAHCHGDMTMARGLGDDLTLQEQNRCFADTQWFRTLTSEEERFFSRQLTYCEALLSGTTFQMENMYWGLGERSAEAMAQTGIRGALAEDIRPDFSKPDVLISPDYAKRFSETCRDNGLTPVIGSLSEEDFDTERLRKIRKFCGDLGLCRTYHLAETQWREEIVREKFGTSSVSYLAENHLLSKGDIASHVVWLDTNEIHILAESGVAVANTPLCEMKIADGIAPIPEMVRSGVTVCLGTDGAMWNNSNDLFREMKGMALLHTVHSGIRSLSARDILDMATLQGAKAFGLSENLGTIEEGKQADLILIKTDTPHMQPLRTGLCENVTSAVVFSAVGADVTDVYVKGRHLVANSQLQSVNLDELIQKVQQTSEKIAQDVEKNKRRN